MKYELPETPSPRYLCLEIPCELQYRLIHVFHNTYRNGTEQQQQHYKRVMDYIKAEFHAAPMSSHHEAAWRTALRNIRNGEYYFSVAHKE